jgi:CDP-6-deoxy-D-xylo-4-hexulose-3-dehydrase
MNEVKKKILDLVQDYSVTNLGKKDFVPGQSDIPVTGKVIDSLEIQNMVEASLDGWLTAGRFNSLFQKQLAEFLNIKCLITVNSGSSANLIAFSTLTSPKLKERSIKKGDEVITVAASFPTTINPIIQFGAIPVFIDVKVPTYNINENLVEDAITEKTRAIVIAHTLGNPFNVRKIKEICDKYNLWLIEDTCDALGSKFNNQFVGTFGDIATLSFYPAHHITMGEGGAVFTNSIKLKRIAESFRDWGRDCYCEPGKDNTCNKRFEWQLGNLPFGYDHKYTYSHMGYNMKITDMQAACGVAQLTKLDHFINLRKRNFKFLYENLKALEEFLLLPEAELNSDPSWFGFPLSLKINKKFNRNNLIKYLNENKIGTRLLFAGNVTKQPYMKGLNFRVSGDLTNTDYVMENTFWIGLYPGLTSQHLEYVVSKLKFYFQK